MKDWGVIGMQILVVCSLCFLRKVSCHNDCMTVLFTSQNNHKERICNINNIYTYILSDPHNSTRELYS